MINAIIICTFISCASQRKQNISDVVVGFEKYNTKTVILIDFLNRDKIPNILKTYYYNNLGKQDFYTPLSIISKTNNTRTIYMKSKQVKEGFLFINKYTNNFITYNMNIVYLIGKDTINSKEKVYKLINLKKIQVERIDTITQGDLGLIKIQVIHQKWR